MKKRGMIFLSAILILLLATIVVFYACNQIVLSKNVYNGNLETNNFSTYAVSVDEENDIPDNTAPAIILESEGNQTWSKTSSVKVTISDSDSGLAAGANIKYGWSTSNTVAPRDYVPATVSEYFDGTKSATFTASSSGLTGKYYLWVVPATLNDMLGNLQTASKVSSDVFLLDNIDPTPGTLIMKLENSEGEDYTNDTWTNKSVYIKPVDGSDANSEHGETTYTINGGNPQNKETILVESGTYEIVVTTTDNAGNTVTTNYKIKIDKDAPKAGTIMPRLRNSSGEVYTNDTWVNQNIYVELLEGSDEGSGHKETTYAVNGGEAQVEPMIITQAGINEIVVTTTDNAGNVSTNTYKAKIDRMVPRISGVTGNRDELSTDPVTITIEDAIDTEAGLAEEAYSFDGGDTWQQTNSKTFIENTFGISILVRDRLGNIYTHYEKIDITKIVVILVGLEVVTPPTKTEYKAYEKFDYKGMVVKAIYSNGTTRETRNYAVLNEGDLDCSTTEITIQSNENPEITTTLPITVGHALLEATCTEPPRCKVHGCTYTEGEPLGHEFIEYVPDNNATCTENETETSTCNRNGCEEKNSREIEDTKLGHEFTYYVSDNNATCTKDGTKTATCDREGCGERDTITDKGSKLYHNFEDGICKDCGAEETLITITSEKYNIEDMLYITQISDKTTLEEFLSNIETNAEEMKVYDKKNQEIEADDIIATGMYLTLKLNDEEMTFILVVAGDVTGDGKSDFKDIVLINKHRLHKTTLDGEFLMAGEVTGDNKVDFKDIVKINKYRLNKIEQLFNV